MSFLVLFKISNEVNIQTKKKKKILSYVLKENQNLHYMDPRLKVFSDNNY